MGPQPGDAAGAGARARIWHESTQACCAGTRWTRFFRRPQGLRHWFTGAPPRSIRVARRLQEVEPFNVGEAGDTPEDQPLARWSMSDVWLQRRPTTFPLLPLYAAVTRASAASRARRCRWTHRTRDPGDGAGRSSSAGSTFNRSRSRESNIWTRPREAEPAVQPLAIRHAGVSRTRRKARRLPPVVVVVVRVHLESRSSPALPGAPCRWRR